MQGLSAPLIVGVAITAALVLVVLLVNIFVVPRRRDRGSSDEEKTQNMWQGSADISWPNPQDRREQTIRIVRSVSRGNLTPSIILPLPVPPEPAACPRPPNVTEEPALNSSGRPMSSTELLANYQATRTTLRPFIPHQTSLKRISSCETQTSPLPSACASSSRNSIISQSLRNSHSSSLRSSSFGAGEGSALVKDCQVFSQHLSHELVPPPHEGVIPIQSFDDGQSIVSNKSCLHAPRPDKSTEYVSGQGTASPDVEIVTAPLKMIEKRANGSAKTERPMRTERRLEVTLLNQSKVGSRDAMDEVISLANF